jgi:phosphate-selective porin OprO and OprP
VSRLTMTWVAVGALLLAAAPQAFADDAAPADTVTMSKEDLQKMMQKEIKSYFHGLKIGGRIQVESQFTTADDGVEGPAPGIGDVYDDVTYLRRARVSVEGDITSHIGFKIQMDFATPSDPKFADCFVTFKNLKECWGCRFPNIRVGQHYEPIGLETLTSDNDLTFIERSALCSTHPERSIGISAFDSWHGDRITGQVGVWSVDSNDDGSGFGLWDDNKGDGGLAVDGRITAVPWARDTCHLVHVGVGASYRRPHQVRYRARPGLGRGPRTIDTGTISDPDNVILVDGEFGFIWNQFHGSADYTWISVSDSAVDDPVFSGWSAQVGWFVTGEHRRWDFKNGYFAGTPPCCEFLDAKKCCCLGAFELGARYDYLDLNDGTIMGGTMGTITVGANWYFHKNAVLQADYVISNTKDRNSGGAVLDDVNVDSFLLRLVVHW